jgi:hypothetical protein
VLAVWGEGGGGMNEMPVDKGLGYLHDKYERIEIHKAESIWQECWCRSCQDMREVRKHKWGTAYRGKDERY